METACSRAPHWADIMNTRMQEGAVSESIDTPAGPPVLLIHTTIAGPSRTFT